MVPRDVAALVTGASRGIGEAVARQLARVGHPVIVNYCSNDAAATRGMRGEERRHERGRDLVLPRLPRIEDRERRPTVAGDAPCKGKQRPRLVTAQRREAERRSRIHVSSVATRRATSDGPLANDTRSRAVPHPQPLDPW